ncbi:hypothetical protein [Thioclava kandeliae]|uniref:DUF982 domain-containing protein n=1 Tax=Thioclava kandeliae TaxID=3070818 RepID=A0ABV1SKD2_9RHOB
MANVIAIKRSEIQTAALYSERDEVNEFLGFCAGILCDGVILPEEADAILARIRSSDTLTSSRVYRDLWRAAEAAMADRVLSADEVEEIRQ